MKSQNNMEFLKRKSSKEIALEFSEKFQNNYPNKPLWKMMDELASAIDELVKQEIKNSTEPSLINNRIPNESIVCSCIHRGFHSNKEKQDNKCEMCRKPITEMETKK